MKVAFIWPGTDTGASVGTDVIRLRCQPGRPVGRKCAPLGGQGILVVAGTDKQAVILTDSTWFARPDVLANSWELGGYSALPAVVEAPGFATGQPKAGVET